MHMYSSDKERPKGRVGSGSDNARGSPILTEDIERFKIFKIWSYLQIYQATEERNTFGKKVISLVTGLWSPS